MNPKHLVASSNGGYWDIDLVEASIARSEASKVRIDAGTRNLNFDLGSGGHQWASWGCLPG